MEVVEKENLHTTNDGLEAIIFTAQGDMRQVGKRTVYWTIFSEISSLGEEKNQQIWQVDAHVTLKPGWVYKIRTCIISIIILDQKFG